ncbi:MAG TPA: hypothetical protein VF456_13190 [Vicinamibacterales bacterium]
MTFRMAAAVIAAAAFVETTAVGASAAPQSAAPSLDRPCSFATAAEVSGLNGATVSSASDEHFRCKYNVGSGWLETKLMDYALKASRDIYEYDKAHGKAAPGVGDQAYILGATLAAKLGDVIIVVDGSNMPRPPADARLIAVAKKIIAGIP